MNLLLHLKSLNRPGIFPNKRAILDPRSHDHLLVRSEWNWRPTRLLSLCWKIGLLRAFWWDYWVSLQRTKWTTYIDLVPSRRKNSSWTLDRIPFYKGRFLSSIVLSLSDWNKDLLSPIMETTSALMDWSWWFWGRSASWHHIKRPTSTGRRLTFLRKIELLSTEFPMRLSSLQEISLPK